MRRKRVMAKAGAGVPSANRITLLRDADGNGVAEVRTIFLEGLDSPRFDAAFGNAMSLAIANTFWLAVGATILGLLAALLLRELPLRSQHPAADPPARAAEGMSAPPLPAAD